MKVHLTLAELRHNDRIRYVILSSFRPCLQAGTETSCDRWRGESQMARVYKQKLVSGTILMGQALVNRMDTE